MDSQTERKVLEKLLARVRKRIFLQRSASVFLRSSLVAVPALAMAIAANERWNSGRGSIMLGSAVLGGLVAFSLIRGFAGLGARVRSALTLDEGAGLKDRISSAYEFLADGPLDEARGVQVQDAIRRAQALDFKKVLAFQRPQYAAYLPIALVALGLSFFVPSAARTGAAVAGPDLLKQAQLEELQALQKELQAQEQPSQELQEALKKLQDIKKQFEKGEMSEREVMLQLARLDENLRQKMAQMGVENLEAEMNAMIPHLLSSAATLEAATALKEKKLDKASDELQKLAEKVKQDKISKEQKRELAMNLGVAASKLGGKQNGSFGGDFAQASEALEKSDAQKFEGACKSMCNKLDLLKKARSMKMACNKIGNCKSCLGQCDSKEFGFSLSPKQQGKNKGGLKAGTAASGNPLGEASRLADSYKKMLRVSGQAGNGPTESETEISEGQMSESQLDAKDVHATYAAVAEEVIEKENIPLSHRYHVKRYFQAIRPQE